MSNFLVNIMASERDEFDKNIDNLKTTVRSSFARIYATLKARELKTLRQLDAVRKQSQDIKDLNKISRQNIKIYFDNEPDLLENVNKYGAIDFECLNFDSSTFVLEDYINPENDHMYSYKDITNVDDLAIEEAALKQITASEHCICHVDIRRDEVSQKFRDNVITITQSETNNSRQNSILEDLGENIEAVVDSNKEKCNVNILDMEVKKIEPTDDWLNSIKNQTETEPSQNVDVMEHSTIACL